MRKLLALAVVLLASAAFTMSSPAAVFSLYVQGPDGARDFFCSGALVTTGKGVKGLTADHCFGEIEDKKDPSGFKAPVYASFDDGDSYVKVIAYKDGDAGDGLDAYLVEPAPGYKWPAVKPFTAAKSDLAPGDYIESWGFPAGAGLTYTRGYVRIPFIKRAWTADQIKWYGYVAAELNVTGGASGSTVLNEAGEVVGVLVGTYSSPQGFQLAVYLPISKVADWLK